MAGNWQIFQVTVCGTPFSVDHAMICQHSGLTYICHNDLTAEWLQEVCHNVTVEPPLLPLNGEPSSSNCSNTTRAGIYMQGASGAHNKVHCLALGFSPQCTKDLKFLRIKSTTTMDPSQR